MSRFALLVAELVHTQIYEIYIWKNIEGKLVHVSHFLLINTINIPLCDIICNYSIFYSILI